MGVCKHVTLNKPGNGPGDEANLLTRKVNFGRVCSAHTYDKDWEEDSAGDGKGDSNSYKDVLWGEINVYVLIMVIHSCA